LPILLIPLLVPHGAPYEEEDVDGESDVSGSAADTSTDSRSQSLNRRKKVHKKQAYENVLDTSDHSASSGGRANGRGKTIVEDDDDHEIMLMPTWKDNVSISSGGDGATFNPLRKNDRAKMSKI
jgi:hypothetical protein